MGMPPSDLFASRFWYPFEKVTFAPDSRFLISPFDIFSDDDSFRSMLMVKGQIYNGYECVTDLLDLEHIWNT